MPSRIFFSIMSYLIAVPTGVKFFNWIGTMWRDAITFETAMLFAIGFMVTFLFGGLSGVADALARVVEREASGAFNLAGEPAFDRAQVRRLFGGVGPSLPLAAARPVTNVAWLLRLQPTEPGFIDLVRGLPLLRCDRAQRDVGWSPAHPADDVLTDFLQALRERSGGPSPLLHPRRALPA